MGRKNTRYPNVRPRRNRELYPKTTMDAAAYLIRNIEKFDRFYAAYYLLSRFPEIEMRIVVSLPLSNSTIMFHSSIGFNHTQYSEINRRRFTIRVKTLDDPAAILIDPIPESFLTGPYMMPQSIKNKALFEEHCRKIRLALDNRTKKYMLVGGKEYEKNNVFLLSEVDDEMLEEIDREVENDLPEEDRELYRIWNSS